MTTGPRADWQIMLADLGLILFTVATVAGTSADARLQSAGKVPTRVAAEIPVAVYRPPVDVADWLRSQAHDPRARLTITARFVAGGQGAALETAGRLSVAAAQAGYTPRLVVEPDDRTDLFATFSYDQQTSATDARSKGR